MNTEEKRNYGISLLKIYAFFGMLVLHCLGHGGILEHAVINSSQYKMSWLLEIITYPAVDIFALISGYIYYQNEKVKKVLSNVFKLWVTIVFYGLLITLLFDVFSKLPIEFNDYLINIFPITNNLYWYFTAYVGLAVLMPVLVKGLENIDDSKAKKLFWIIIIVYSVFDRLVNRFCLYRGYSVIWLILLFILGALIKKCNIGKNITNIKATILIIVLFIITYLYKIYGPEFMLFDIQINKDLFVDYTSITILFSAILLLIIFARFSFGDKMSKIINSVSLSAFYVYIINENKIIRDDFIVGLFSKIANDSFIKIFAYVIGFSIAFFILSIIIDKIRLFIFDKLGINKLISKSSKIIDRIGDYY